MGGRCCRRGRAVRGQALSRPGVFWCHGQPLQRGELGGKRCCWEPPTGWRCWGHPCGCTHGAGAGRPPGAPTAHPQPQYVSYRSPQCVFLAQHSNQVFFSQRLLWFVPVQVSVSPSHGGASERCPPRPRVSGGCGGLPSSFFSQHSY